MRMKLTNLIFVGLVVTAATITTYGQSFFLGPVSEFSLGSDGTIYVITHVAKTSTTSASTELTAYDGTNGSKVSNTLTIPIGGLGQPVPAPDGRLFFVAEGQPGWTTKSTTVAAENAQVIIVKLTGGVLAYTTVQLSGETALGPVFLGTSAGYKYYVTVTSVSQGPSEKPVVTTELYVYSGSNDNQLFSVPLN
jgi:hypothetical protein